MGGTDWEGWGHWGGGCGLCPDRLGLRRCVPLVKLTSHLFLSLILNFTSRPRKEAGDKYRMPVTHKHGAMLRDDGYRGLRLPLKYVRK